MPIKDLVKRIISWKKWYNNNRETILPKQRAYHARIKKLVFSHYCTNEIKCACCGEKIIEFLSIDHIDGGGTQHRSKIGKGYIYFWIKKNNFPSGFRVLCHNCNQAIGMYGKCPHDKLK